MKSRYTNRTETNLRPIRWPLLWARGGRNTGKGCRARGNRTSADLGASAQAPPGKPSAHSWMAELSPRGPARPPGTCRPAHPRGVHQPPHCADHTGKAGGQPAPARPCPGAARALGSSPRRARGLGLPPIEAAPPRGRGRSSDGCQGPSQRPKRRPRPGLLGVPPSRGTQRRTGTLITGAKHVLRSRRTDTMWPPRAAEG